MSFTTGIIYRNPKPHVASRHAYFPWVIQLQNGDLLASFVIAEAFESANSNTYISRSKDGGKSWSEPLPVISGNEIRGKSNCARITAVGDNEVVAIMVRSDREKYPGEGLANPENMGFVPTEVLLLRSADNGSTWSAPKKIIPPLIGPAFEACSPVVVLSDGRWLWPTSTWRDWNGYAPNGMKMVAIESFDKGKTWPSYLDVMDGSANKIINWEGKIVELTDNKLVSLSWVYDEKNGRDLPNHFSISNDGGKTWTTPKSTNTKGQTAALIKLPGEKLLMVYRRLDKPGLWAEVAHIENNEWIQEKTFCVWQGNMKTEDKPENMVQEFNELKFGAPCALLLSDGAVLIAFWCYENMVSNIRWFRIEI